MKEIRIIQNYKMTVLTTLSALFESLLVWLVSLLSVLEKNEGAVY